MSKFKRQLSVVVKCPPSQVNPHKFNRMATFSFGLGHYSSVDVDTPVWFIVIHLEAMHLLGKKDGQFVTLQH